MAAPAPYSHHRISPGHFVVHPTPTRSPLHPPQQQQCGAALGPMGGATPALPRGDHSGGSGALVAAAGSGPVAAGTPLSQQGSRASSALVDNLNLALRALGG